MLEMDNMPILGNDDGGDDKKKVVERAPGVDRHVLVDVIQTGRHLETVPSQPQVGG